MTLVHTRVHRGSCLWLAHLSSHHSLPLLEYRLGSYSGKEGWQTLLSPPSYSALKAGQGQQYILQKWNEKFLKSLTVNLVSEWQRLCGGRVAYERGWRSTTATLRMRKWGEHAACRPSSSPGWHTIASTLHGANGGWIPICSYRFYFSLCVCTHICTWRS